MTCFILYWESSDTDNQEWNLRTLDDYKQCINFENFPDTGTG